MKAQNKYFIAFAEQEIQKMSYAEKEYKIQELLDLGYEYNEGYGLLLEVSEVDIPYDFILLCKLIDSIG